MWNEMTTGKSCLSEQRWWKAMEKEEVKLRLQSQKLTNVTSLAQSRGANDRARVSLT